MSVTCARICRGMTILVFIVLLAGCNQVQQVRYGDNVSHLFNDALFGPRPAILGKQDIFALSDDQRQAFLSYFNAAAHEDVEDHRRVYNYLDTIVKNFNYQGNTFTAEEALRRSSGNCLSLAIITTALARTAHVDIAYQLVDDIPVYEQKGQIVFKGVHVRSVLYYTNLDMFGIDDPVLRPYIKVDYFPSGNERFIRFINENEYVSMYYRNMAAEALALDDFSQAYWLYRTALEQNPYSGDAVNGLAVVHARAGDETTAERLYEYGIAHSDEKLTLLKNYVILLKRQGRYVEAEAVNAQVDMLDDPSPFRWMQLADEAYENGDYQEAIRYYGKAMDLAPYLDRGYFGLARTWYQLGNRRAAERNMRLAMEHAFKRSTISLYEAKLAIMTKE